MSRVVVLGAGLVGTATAWYLRALGQEVVVVDRAKGVALEASFANGGLVTPSTSDSWAAPGTPTKILKWLGKADAPIRLRPSAIPGMAGWGLKFLANCTAASWRRNTGQVLALAQFSLGEFNGLTRELGLVFDRNPPGLLKLFRDPHSMESALRANRVFTELGVRSEILDVARSVAMEPALAPIRDQISGAILYPDDESGDAHGFTRALADAARRAGVEFRFGTTIGAPRTEGGRVVEVATDKGPVRGDVFVVALGSYSPAFGRRLGLSWPIYPGKGYSITVDASGWNGAPRIPVADDGRKMAVTPMGGRLRVAGTVEFAGLDASLDPVRGRMLVEGLDAILPDRPRDARIEHWAGLRPMTPHGRPLIGPTRLPNLFVNAGHGPLGFTLACGSGRALAERITGRTPGIDLAAYAP